MPLGYVIGAKTFSQIVGKILRKHATAISVGGLTGVEIMELVKKEAPDSDEQSLLEVTDAIERIVDEDQVLWPEDRQGNKIAMNYIVMNTKTGNMWVTSKYRNKNTENAAFRRGQRSGRNQLSRELKDRTIQYSGVHQ